MSPNSIRIVIVDDHPVVREGLERMLASEQEFSIVGSAGTGAEALGLLRELHPNVVIVDLLLPDMHGAHLISQIRESFPLAQTIVLTSVVGDEEIHRALEAGARAYLFKDMARLQLVSAIRTVHKGQRYIPPAVCSRLAAGVPRVLLSTREIDVLARVARGRGNKQIAYEMSLSEATVNAHLKHISQKLNTSDRTEAVTVALQRGFFRLADRQ